jgi:hypothetical protein
MMLRRDHMLRPARLWMTDAGKKNRGDWIDHEPSFKPEGGERC